MDLGDNYGKQLCCKHHGINLCRQFSSHFNALDIVFDLLYVNEGSVMDLPLRERLALVKRCIPHQKPKQIEICKQYVAKTTEDIIEALETAIQSR